MFLFMLPWTATDKAREYAADVELALEKAGIQKKEAASIMRIPESLLSEQLHCVDGKQLSGSRLADLPQAFQDEFNDLRTARSGAVMLRRDLVELLRGAALVGRKVMARAHLAGADVRRRA